MVHKKLYDIDTFIKTAIGIKYKGFNRVKAAGFKSFIKNKDMYYVDNENKFKKELDYYLTH